MPSSLFFSILSIFIPIGFLPIFLSLYKKQKIKGLKNWILSLIFLSCLRLTESLLQSFESNWVASGVESLHFLVLYFQFLSFLEFFLNKQIQLKIQWILPTILVFLQLLLFSLTERIFYPAIVSSTSSIVFLFYLGFGISNLRKHFKSRIGLTLIFLILAYSGFVLFLTIQKGSDLSGMIAISNFEVSGLPNLFEIILNLFLSSTILIFLNDRYFLSTSSRGDNDSEYFDANSLPIQEDLFLEKTSLELQRSRRFKHSLSLLMVSFPEEISKEPDHIRKISYILKDNVRNIDIINRTGENEFSILLIESGLEAGVFVGKRILEEFLSKSFPSSLRLFIGVKSLDQNTGSLEVLLDGAKKAMLSSKNAGGNQVCVYKPELE